MHCIRERMLAQLYEGCTILSTEILSGVSAVRAFVDHACILLLGGAGELWPPAVYGCSGEGHPEGFSKPAGVHAGSGVS
jgi:hypothetical protein